MNRRSIAVLLALAVVTVVVVAAGCGGLPGTAVAKVGDVYIDNAKFTQQVDSYATQDSIDRQTDPEGYKSLAQNVLDFLVATELAAQRAESLGITVTDAEVQTQITSIVNNYFSADEAQLVTYLATQKTTMADLKKEIKSGLLAGKVRDQVVKDVAAPSASEIASYYEANKADYLTARTVDARHILVGVGKGSVRSTAATTTTTALSTETAESTTTTASTESTTTIPELTWAKALAAAAQLRADLLAGGSWAKLAAKYSNDPDTKNKGGNLGTVAQGSLVSTLGQEFDTSLFALTLDQISEPVKTEHGYEIIQVTKITEPQQQSLEEAKADIAAALLADAQDSAWQTFIDKAKKEIKVVYRDDMKPVTTTTQAPTTTTLPPAATTTTAGETTTTLKP